MKLKELDSIRTKLSEAASPIQVKGTTDEGNPFHIQGLGLSKREWFAGMAMQGLLSMDVIRYGLPTTNLADTSIAIADELISQLNDHKRK